VEPRTASAMQSDEFDSDYNETTLVIRGSVACRSSSRWATMCWRQVTAPTTRPQQRQVAEEERRDGNDHHIGIVADHRAEEIAVDIGEGAAPFDQVADVPRARFGEVSGTHTVGHDREHGEVGEHVEEQYLSGDI
jgi:hypothetical protein